MLKNTVRLSYYGISAFVSPIFLETESELFFAENITIPRKILGEFHWKFMNLFELANPFPTPLLQRLAGSAEVSGVNFTIVCCFQMHRSSRPLQPAGPVFHSCRCLKLHAGSKKKYSLYLCASALWRFVNYWIEFSVEGLTYFHCFYRINGTLCFARFLKPRLASAVMHIHPESFKWWNLDTFTSHPTSAIFLSCRPLINTISLINCKCSTAVIELIYLISKQFFIM